MFILDLFLPTGLILNIKLLKAVHVSKYFDDQFFWEVSFQMISDSWGEFILHLAEELQVFELKIWGGKGYCFSQHILMHKEPLGTLRWEEKQMGEKQL